MKLAITSDLHLPKMPTEMIAKLLQEIAAEKPDRRYPLWRPR